MNGIDVNGIGASGVAAGLILGGYLLGSVSSSLLLVRALRDLDVRQVGSGNPGATNVLRVVGKGPAFLVLLLDLGKGLAPVSLARWLAAPGPVIGAVAVATVVGHIFPIYHGFRGGKGVATATGALTPLAPLPALLSAAIFGLVVAVSRYVALGSIAAIGLFPLFAYLCGRLAWTPPPPFWLLLGAASIAALIVVRHSENLRRLREGTELKLGREMTRNTPQRHEETTP